MRMPRDDLINNFGTVPGFWDEGIVEDLQAAAELSLWLPCWCWFFTVCLVAEKVP